jgi:hypothetical protein
MLNSIKIRIFVYQLTQAILAMLFLGITGYFLMENYINVSQKEKLKYIANFKEEEIRHYFTETKASLERAANSREFEDFYLTFRDVALIKHFTKFNQVFSAMSYINIAGDEEIKVVRNKVDEQTLTNISKNLTFQNSLKEPNKVIISPVEPSPELGEPVIRFMLSKNAYFGEKFIGTLVGTIPISKITDRLKDKIGKSGFFSLIDNNGNILFYPKKEKVFAKITGKGEKAEKLIAD